MYLPFTQELKPSHLWFYPLPHPYHFPSCFHSHSSFCLPISYSLPSISELILDMMHFTSKHFIISLPVIGYKSISTPPHLQKLTLIHFYHPLYKSGAKFVTLKLCFFWRKNYFRLVILKKEQPQKKLRKPSRSCVCVCTVCSVMYESLWPHWL